MRMSRVAVLPLIATLAIGLAACGNKDNGSAAPGLPGGGGGANPGAAEAKNIDLCGVITLDKAKKLIGDDAKVKPGRAQKCEYEAESKGLSITAEYKADASGEDWKLTKQIGGQSEPVAGAGDEAFFRPQLATLYARKNGVNFEVQVVHEGGESPLEECKQLMTEILAKA